MIFFTFSLSNSYLLKGEWALGFVFNQFIVFPKTLSFPTILSLQSSGNSFGYSCNQPLVIIVLTLFHCVKGTYIIKPVFY